MNITEKLQAVSKEINDLDKRRAVLQAKRDRLVRYAHDGTHNTGKLGWNQLLAATGMLPRSLSLSLKRTSVVAAGERSVKRAVNRADTRAKKNRAAHVK
jgi:hypothetical protein